MRSGDKLKSLLPQYCGSGRAVTCSEEFPSVKSHDPLITWYSDFGFSYAISRFRKQTPNFLLRLLVKHNALELPFSPSSAELFRGNGEFGAKKYFTDHRTADTIQLFVATEGNFCGLFFV